MKKLIKKLLRERLDDTYHGEHQAPDKDGAPMYDLNGMYPDDIYSNNAARLYGNNNDEYSDYISLSIIRDAKNRPNLPIKIYRAIPDINYDIDKKIKEYNDIINYYYKYKFFPSKNKIIYDLQDKYPVNTHGYDKSIELILQHLIDEVSKLSESKSDKLAINSGDWITINLEYAKSHGKNNLNNKYKIITKTVKAKNLYTDGNSIHEWGYVK